MFPGIYAHVKHVDVREKNSFCLSCLMKTYRGVIFFFYDAAIGTQTPNSLGNSCLISWFDSTVEDLKI